VAGGVPYLVQAYLPGTQLDVLIEQAGTLSADAALPHLTQIAAALDFAAASGVHHGFLTLRDIIVSPTRSGVTGFGLAQVLAMAGLPPADAVDDLRGLALAASVMLGRPVRGPVAEVIASGLVHHAGERHDSALAFVARLQEAVDDETAPAAPAPATMDEEPFVERLVEPVPVSMAPRRSIAATYGAAALVIGLMTGFAGGFVAGQRQIALTPDPEVTGTRGFSEAPVETKPEPVEAAPVVAPAPTVVDPPAAEAPVAPPAVPPAAEPPVPPVAETPGAPVADTPAPRGPGRLTVFSRPSGAQVFLDERPVGTTPLSLADVTPGRHTVRIALPGHQRWATDIEVTPGMATRVAASLEQ
jgi:hypothetical protein